MDPGGTHAIGTHSGGTHSIGTHSVGTGARSRTIGVAVAIPEPWGGELQAWRESFGDPQAASIPTHVTLLAPTVVEERALTGVDDHLRKIAEDERAFTMTLRGTECFRPVSPVVFIELRAGGTECTRIEEKVRSGPLHRPVDFAYHPHVTIAHDLAPPVLDRALVALADYAATFQVDGFKLYEHVGGVWQPVRAFAFPATA